MLHYLVAIHVLLFLLKEKIYYAKLKQLSTSQMMINNLNLFPYFVFSST